MEKKNVSRRTFLNIAVSAVVAGVVAGVGSYYAGLLSAPPGAITTTTVTQPGVTTTVTAPGVGVTTTTTKTVTGPATTVTAPPVTTTTTVTKTPTPTTPAPEAIKIGCSFGLTGPYSVFGDEAHFFGERWKDYVNSLGGIYVKEYDRKIPVQLIWYDDMSDPTKEVSNIERLALVDKVHFIMCMEFGFGTTGQIAAARHELFWIGHGGVSKDDDQYEFASTYDYIFDFHNHEAKNIVNIFKWAKNDGRPKTIFMLSEDSGGTLTMVEGSKKYPQLYGGLIPHCDEYGIKLVGYQKFTIGTKDFTDVILKAKAANPDIVFSFWLPPDAVGCVKQSRELGFQPGIWYAQKGIDLYSVTDPSYPYFEGFVVPLCIWNEDLPYMGMEAKAFKDKFGYYPCIISASYVDCWPYLQQAIEYAGTITDKDKLKDAYYTVDFHSVVPRTSKPIPRGQPCAGYFEPLHIMCQYQNKKRRTIFPPDQAKAKAWYPIPTWAEKFPPVGEYKPPPVEYP